MAMLLKGLLAELLFGNIGVEIPTYVKNDNNNNGILQQIEPTGTVSNEKRLNGLLESNRGDRETTLGRSWGIYPKG